VTKPTCEADDTKGAAVQASLLLARSLHCRQSQARKRERAAQLLVARLGPRY